MKIKNKIQAFLIIFTFLCLIVAVPAYDLFNGTLLFNTSVKKNRIIPGNYSLLRSYRHITQILECKNFNQVILYHDYNNRLNSGIKTYTYSLYLPYVKKNNSVSENEYIEKVKKIMQYGCAEKNNTLKYDGLSACVELVKKGRAVITKKDGIYYIKPGNINKKYILTYNGFTNTLKIINTSLNRKYTDFIVVKESKDSVIRKILNDFYIVISDLYEKKKS